ncbi:MAG: D-alanyl-D-alanine carboxypeptidase [Clostridia bacterium]|nr:D-alanyl-D-alanine carboxypeptidase [Clostridia bacterium]
MRKFTTFLIVFVLFCSFLVLSNQSKFVCYAQGDSTELNFAPNSKACYLVESSSGKVLFSKNETAPLPIASMTKMMSLKLIFDAIDSGLINENGDVYVTENAASVGGSSAFLDGKKTYKVGELIKSVIIASANDSTVALAEAVSGSEAVFVSKMNEEAKKLNLVASHFVNSTGLPAPEHYSCAKDCATIYMSICENPIYQKYAKIWIDKIVHPGGRETGLVNTNRLVKTFPGCFAGKTGYTSEAKYCLTCSAKRGDTHLVAVVIGEPDSKTRFAECVELFNYGFANFESKPIITGTTTFSVDVKGSSKQTISAKPAREYFDFCEKGSASTKTYIEKYDNINAPISAGSKIGKVLIIDANNVVVDEIDLIAIDDAPKLTLMDCFKKAISRW